MKEQIEVKQKSVEDYVQKSKTYHCPKCMANFTFPQKQTKGLECPFCHSELVSGEIGNEENENSKPESKYLLIIRDENNKITKIEQVDKEEFEKRSSSENKKMEIKESLKENKYFKKIDFKKYNPLNSIRDNGIYVVVYKDRDYCNITNIIEKMLKEAESRLKKDFEDFSFNYIISKKDSQSYTNKKVLVFPQIFIFYKNNDKEYALDFINIKDFNADTIYSKILYWKNLSEINGL